MNEYIKVFSRNSNEHKRLELAAQLMTMFSRHGYQYYVEDEVYFDYGQDWKWTTILVNTNGATVQVCSPRDQASLILASSPAQLGAVIEDMWADKFSVEKVVTASTDVTSKWAPGEYDGIVFKVEQPRMNGTMVMYSYDEFLDEYGYDVATTQGTTGYPVLRGYKTPKADYEYTCYVHRLDEDVEMFTEDEIPEGCEPFRKSLVITYYLED